VVKDAQAILEIYKEQKHYVKHYKTNWTNKD
jgi:hypothetical protein